MSELITSILESLRDPPRLHAMTIHLPIAFALAGVIATMALAATRGRSSKLRWTAIAIFLAGTLAGLWARHTGEKADEHLSARGVELTSEAGAAFEQHEVMGEKIWGFLAASAAAVALTAIRKPMIRIAAVVLALATGLFTLAGVAVTAHYGGKLVYVHGIGVPATSNNFPAAK